MLSKLKAQSTLEYIVVFVAIVAAIVWVAMTKLQPAANRVIEASANKIIEAANTFENATIVAQNNIGN